MFFNIQTIVIFLFSVHFLSTGNCSFNLSKKTNFIVYWGANVNQGQLFDYCHNNVYDAIILAFASSINSDGILELTIDKCNGFGGQSCIKLGKQIQNCQKNGKLIVLSIGGANGNYTIKSAIQATQTAIHIWNQYLNGKSNEVRPFGPDVILDGIDLDIEMGAPIYDKFYVTLVKKLRSLMKSKINLINKSFIGRNYLISGAPQCFFPDAWLGPNPHTAITNSDLDYVSVQFYNNGCGIQAFFGIQQFGGGTFNFQQWSETLKRVLVNKKMKLFLGIPASLDAGGGYQNASRIKQIYQNITHFNNLAGIMMYDAAYAIRNNHFGQQIRRFL
ncbi:unnamed protein product [Didymodactylos carnosus]|uniref:chitinase n=1 Tax=Didymodactylos carnosus TaxID=1234261 RepID=A0A815H483_9BILA|nr:unnamed protein product [Didymodactylos carnosus]CAF1347049.1 unnamed protein product [Didymodactylos carnosus]CAF4007065.1 unnamed protein product [Didymodactylos carnosus]CAF4213853.1 unnamed protein product [Didymodactylos carnosus]